MSSDSRFEAGQPVLVTSRYGVHQEAVVRIAGLWQPRPSDQLIADLDRSRLAGFGADDVAALHADLDAGRAACVVTSQGFEELCHPPFDLEAVSELPDEAYSWVDPDAHPDTKAIGWVHRSDDCYPYLLGEICEWRHHSGHMNVGPHFYARLIEPYPPETPEEQAAVERGRARRERTGKGKVCYFEGPDGYRWISSLGPAVERVLYDWPGSDDLGRTDQYPGGSWWRPSSF